MKLIRDKLNNNKYCKLIKNSSTYKGIERGWSVELAPPFLIKFQNKILVRIARVVGGVCVLISFSKYYLLAPKFFQQIILLLALIQLIWMFISCVIKIGNGIYVLLYQKEKLQIKK
uniref:hypothetical protein n=1 Tax=Hericium alpestre TaxID=135208 RepID=UPI002435DE1F|nr:hypothetical protein QEO35_mgp14 [Hericium alpestre]WEX32019.1 hypothetical protein [Hericium alpestre]